MHELTAAVAQEVKKRPEALRLMTHPGVGPLTALAYVLIIGTPTRFHCGKQMGTYAGMIPSEDSSGGKQRFGAHQPARKFVVAFFVGGGSASGGPNQPGVETSLHTSGDASKQEHRQGGAGTQTGSSLVLDVAEWLRVFAVVRVRFVRGTARTGHRTPSSWLSIPLPQKGSLKK